MWAIKKSTSKEAGKAASLAEDKKLKKYRHLNNDYYVVPVAIETLGSYGPYALDFIKDIGRRIKESTGEKQATSYLMQTIGIAIQRGNSQCILNTVKDSRKMDEVYYLQSFIFHLLSDNDIYLLEIPIYIRPNRL